MKVETVERDPQNRLHSKYPNAHFTPASAFLTLLFIISIHES